MGSVITDDTVEPLAYAVCNTDGVEGLTWAEVELCEVSNCKKMKLKYLPFVEFLELKLSFFVKNSKRILIFFDKRKNMSFAYKLFGHTLDYCI